MCYRVYRSYIAKYAVVYDGVRHQKMNPITDKVLEALEGKNRFMRGEAIVKANHLRKIPKVTKWQLWKVQSETTPGKTYNVVDKGGDFYECDCPDFQQRNVICKHVYACIISEAGEIGAVSS